MRCCDYPQKVSVFLRLVRVQMPAKIFPHLKLLCWLFMGPTLGFVSKQRHSFMIKFGVFYNKNKILTILFIVKYEKITF